jgi:hypothetical protein
MFDVIQVLENWEATSAAMRIVGGLLSCTYLLGLLVLGIAGWPLWVPAVGALMGVFVVCVVRPHTINVLIRSLELGHLGAFAMGVGMAYAIQLALAAVLYGTGRVIGFIL